MAEQSCKRGVSNILLHDLSADAVGAGEDIILFRLVTPLECFAVAIGAKLQKSTWRVGVAVVFEGLRLGLAGFEVWYCAVGRMFACVADDDEALHKDAVSAGSLGKRVWKGSAKSE